MTILCGPRMHRVADLALNSGVESRVFHALGTIHNKSRLGCSTATLPITSDQVDIHLHTDALQSATRKTTTRTCNPICLLLKDEVSCANKRALQNSRTPGAVTRVCQRQLIWQLRLPFDTRQVGEWSPCPKPAVWDGTPEGEVLRLRTLKIS